MKILLLNQFYPPDVTATGQSPADLAAGIVYKGHEVHVLCSRRVLRGWDGEVSSGAANKWCVYPSCGSNWFWTWQYSWTIDILKSLIEVRFTRTNKCEK